MGVVALTLGPMTTTERLGRSTRKLITTTKNRIRRVEVREPVVGPVRKPGQYRSKTGEYV